MMWQESFKDELSKVALRENYRRLVDIKWDFLLKGRKKSDMPKLLSTIKALKKKPKKLVVKTTTEEQKRRAREFMKVVDVETKRLKHQKKLNLMERLRRQGLLPKPSSASVSSKPILIVPRTEREVMKHYSGKVVTTGINPDIGSARHYWINKMRGLPVSKRKLVADKPTSKKFSDEYASYEDLIK